MPIINSSKSLAKGASFGIVAGAESELVLLVEILPARIDSNYQQVGARLSVGGVNVPILSYDESVSSVAAGKTVSITLARIEDRNLLTPDAEFLIETFEANGDEEIIWETVLTGKITEKSVSFANEDGKPLDAVTFTTVSTDKLAKSPNRNLVVYDSVLSDVDASEFEPVYDTAGRAYTLGAVPVANLSLYKLFDEIFVNRCGFSSVVTNLPDYPIRRADFSLFEAFYDGVKPFIGVFDAIDFQSADNKLYLTDATLSLPAGFPAPRVLEAAKIQTISSKSDQQNIEGFELQFSQSETGEFFTTKTQTFPSEVRRAFPGGRISSTERTVKYRQYRSNYARNIVLREIIESEEVKIFGANSIVVPIEVSLETFEFDYLGRQKQTTKTVSKRVPSLPDGSVSLREIQSDELKLSYGIHPFTPRRQFLKRTEFSSEGLIAIDSDNQYFGEDFPQAFTDAHRAGNLKDSMTETSGLLKSITEDFKPLPDGTVQVFTTEIDHTPEAVGRDAIVKTSQGEPRAGDVSVSGAGRAARLYVLPNDADILTTQQLESFAVGELPLRLAVPLARRRLKRIGKQKLDISLVGWNKTVQQGIILQAVGRDNESVNLIAVGYRKFARIENDSLNWGMTLEGAEI